MVESREERGKSREREFEIGMDESWKANLKRTYDEYQHESLESIRQNRTLFDKILTDAQQFDNQRQAIANQALQNAVESANMSSKQAVRHADIAIDRQWNMDEQANMATLIATVVASVLAKLGKEK